MPMPQRQLDNRSYADLLEEARAVIPSLYPGWTDHNPSDPGITLIEMFAWLSELLLYQIDQTPDSYYWAFLKLLNDTRSEQTAWAQRQNMSLQAATRETVKELRSRYRAITAEDYEFLVLHQWSEEPDNQKVAQARCVPQRNLEHEPDGTTEAKGHVSVVIVPSNTDTAEPQPTDQQRAALHDWLEPRRLLGTRVHVVGPRYVPITITATLILRNDYAPRKLVEEKLLVLNSDIEKYVRDTASSDLRTYFDSLRGSSDGRGWPLGRAVYRSEIYQLLDGVEGVDYVESVAIKTDDQERYRTSSDKTVSAIVLAPHELVSVRIAVTVKAAI